MNTTNLFVSEFCQWSQSIDLPVNSRARLSRSLHRAVDVKLVDDDEWRETAVRQLIGSENLNCEFSGEDLWVNRANDGWLEVGTVGPGWRKFDNDEAVVDVISNFFHFAGQYVHRGRAARIIGAIATTYNQACDFRFGNLGLHYISVDEFQKTDRKSLSLTEITSKTRKINSHLREFSAWVKCINGLDPYVQRAVFHFWRAAALLSSNFIEEAVTAFDGLTSIAALFLQDRMSIPCKTRDQLEKQLGLGQKDARNLGLLYQLRCGFGAHPSRSKW